MAEHARETWNCPNCGADVPVGRPACPECGSDAETGWSEDTIHDGLDLPDEAFGETEADRPEDDGTPSKASQIVWGLTTLVVALLMALWVVSKLW